MRFGGHRRRERGERGLDRRYRDGRRRRRLAGGAIAIRLVRAQEEHQQAIVVADTLADAVAVAVEHRLGRSVDRAVEGEIDQPQRRGLHRRIPRRRERAAIGRAAQAVTRGRRHVHLDRGLRDRAGIRQHADERLLRRDRPAIVPHLPADRYPVVFGEVEVLDRREMLGLDDGHRGGPCRLGSGRFESGGDVGHDIAASARARGFGHGRSGSGGRRVGQHLRGLLDFLWRGCGARASVTTADILDIEQNVAHPCPMQTVTYSEARENLKAVLDKVVADRGPVMITRERGENVVLISASEWAGMEETLYLLRSPKNAERLLEAVRGFEADDAEAVPFP